MALAKFATFAIAATALTAQRTRQGFNAVKTLDGATVKSFAAQAALTTAKKTQQGFSWAINWLEDKAPPVKATNDWLRARTPAQSFGFIAAYEGVGPFLYPLYGYLGYAHGWKGAAVGGAIWTARHAFKGYVFPFLILNARKSSQYRRMIHLTQKKKHKFWHATARTVLRTTFGSATHRRNTQRYMVAKDWAKREKRFLAIQTFIQSSWLWPLALPPGWKLPAYAALTAMSVPYNSVKAHRFARHNKFYRCLTRPVTLRACRLRTNLFAKQMRMGRYIPNMG
jgi:hypothetical protein